MRVYLTQLMGVHTCTTPKHNSDCLGWYIRRGMVSLFTQSNYANCELLEFEDFDVKLVIISNRLAVLHIHRILQLGAKGFIYREELASELLRSIDIVVHDTVALSAQA